MLLATVKGDVHDIGKNIVGVVLGCNNYKVIDLGVMVPAQKIFEVAKEERVDMIGLSGLITPSLDEMVHVASEMKRLELELPLLIGGATTSRQHTAVKIAPKYDKEVVHVSDASRVVDVVAKLLDPARRVELAATTVAEQDRLREIYGSKNAKPLTEVGAARAKPAVSQWSPSDVSKPTFTGVHALEDYSLSAIEPYIDWTFFFTSWQLKGRFPQILEHAKYGEAARELYANGRSLLQKIIDNKQISARGVYGFWPANSDGDDIVLYRDESRGTELRRFNMLRQQTTRGKQATFSCLADYVAPRSSGLADYLGGFAVTAGIGADELAAEYEKAGDDYSAIMVKALADRLAEAFAELLHQRARRDWGHGKDLSPRELIAEKYRGIRPAFGYPACPDHSEKPKLFELLDAPSLGITLTESFAMQPGASVSGIYLGHPDARYFTVGRIGRDQVRDYAARKGMDVREAERWLAPNLGYDPEQKSAAEAAA